jgi:hypothetical protein
METTVKIIKGIGLVLLRTIQTVLTLGLFWRFHWITTQIRAKGGRHAGALGMIYVQSDGERLVISRMLRKTRVSLHQVAAVDRSWFPVMGVQIDTTGVRAPTVPTWAPRALGEYIEQAAMPATEVSQAHPARAA